MTKFLFLVFLTIGAIISPNANAQFGPGAPQSYALADFQRFESDAIAWHQRYQAAPSGSWDESYARTQRDQAIQQANMAINNPGAFQGMYSRDVEAWADRFNSKYQAAPSGSALESMYNNARRVAYAAFNQTLMYEVQYITDWRQIDTIAQEMNQKYQAAPSGSAKESAYNQARQYLFGRMPGAFQQEVSTMYDFRMIESFIQYFAQKYQAAPSGSLAERAYSQCRDIALNAAVNSFRNVAPTMDMGQLYQIQDDYHRRYQAAASGSALERYFAQIRDIARSYLR